MTSGSDETDWLSGVAIEPMAPADLDEVLAIENDAFPSAWSRGSYERELRNDSSFYFAARHGPQLVGYAGMWVIFEEAHITTIAVHPSYRRRGLARRLLLLLMEMARQRQSCRLTLEVRQNNAPALALYRQLGFEEKGVLPHYYGDTGEDGVVMWKAL